MKLNKLEKLAVTLGSPTLLTSFIFPEVFKEIVPRIQNYDFLSYSSQFAPTYTALGSFMLFASLGNAFVRAFKQRQEHNSQSLQSQSVSYL